MTETSIHVEPISQSSPLEFEVTVTSVGSTTKHMVSVAKAYCDQLGTPASAPSIVVEATFRFLLDREPKESILRRFDLSVVGQYFPEFDQVLQDYLDRSGEAAPD